MVGEDSLVLLASGSVRSIGSSDVVVVVVVATVRDEQAGSIDQLSKPSSYMHSVSSNGSRGSDSGECGFQPVSASFDSQAHTSSARRLT